MRVVACRMSSKNFRGSCGIKYLSALVHGFPEIGILKRTSHNQIDLPLEERLQVVLKVKKEVKKLAGRQGKKARRSVGVWPPCAAQASKNAFNQWRGLSPHNNTVWRTLNMIAARRALQILPKP